MILPIIKSLREATAVDRSYILKNNPKFKFRIVGGGSELENIKKLAGELKTNDVFLWAKTIVRNA